MKKTGIYILLFLGFFLIFSSYRDFQEQNSLENNTENIYLEVVPSSSIPLNNLVSVKITNDSEETVTLDTKIPPFRVYFQDEEKLFPEYEIEKAWPESIESNSEYTFSFDRWNNDIFDTPGEYKIELLSNSEKTLETSVEITSRGFLSFIWNTLLYKPIYNVLIFITTSLPSKSLGWGIILLTVLLRLVLLIPNQRALESQKKLSQIQPKLQALQEKYKDDKIKLSEETMKVWKENKINPMGSCLPIVIQLPIILALYYVVRDGLLFTKTILLYPPLASTDITLIDTNFLGILPLDTPNRIILPIILVLLQFIQVKLSMVNKPKLPEGTPDPTKMMMYILPIMIGFFAATFPAGLSLYWGTSTVFGIFQQILVNKEKKKQMDSSA